MAVVFFWAGLLASPGYLWLTTHPASWVRSVIKTLPLTCFALAAWVSAAPVWLTAALILSGVGDFALSRPGRKAFLYGLAAFLLAHVMFILLFALITIAAPPSWVAFSLNPLPALTLLMGALSTELWLAPHAGALRWPVRVYVAVITLMGLAALALPTGYSVVVLGAMLFILSDLILAVRTFRLSDGDPRAPSASRGLWVFYIAGQALIVAGIAVL